MKKVDIIIPAYNSHKTIERTLASVLMQTRVKEVRVLVVNDAGKDYHDIVNSFANTSLEVKELTYEINGGPSKARNFGIDNATAEYIMFIDSDDCLSSPWSVDELVTAMDRDPKLNLVTSAFMEELMDNTLKQHDKELTFTHGKIYRKAYLDRHNIRFNENSRSCEDMGFNMLCMLLLNIDKGVSAHTDFVTYYWMNNSNSLGRSNKEIYDSSECTQGYIYNMLYLFEELKKREVDERVLFSEKVTGMIRCVELFASAALRKPEFLEDNKKVLMEFYRKIYKPYADQITLSQVEDAYNRMPKDDREVPIGVVLAIFKKLKTPKEINIKYIYKSFKKEVKVIQQ